ncbi:MAG: YitT family protein [Clostridia bacterium]
MNTQQGRRVVRDFLIVTLGTIFVTVGVYFFKFPNKFCTGGVSGISIILGHYVPNLTAGSFNMIINLSLLALGFLTLGTSFGLLTAYSSIVYSLVIWGLERLMPLAAPMTSQPLLELFFAVMLPAVGSAMLFQVAASTGGTDIIAMLLRKYTSLDIGKALLCVDASITIMACIAFGMETGLFSIFGLILKALVVDMVIENINTCKYFHIITENPEPVCKFIVETLHRGATKLTGEGVFTHKGRSVILTVMNRGQALRLRRHLRETDPHAFITITNTCEIIGKGFRGTN